MVALIQFVRFLLEYLEKKSKLAQAKAGVAGAFVKYVMCCVNCLMWYLEKVVKFINRYSNSPFTQLLCSRVTVLASNVPILRVCMSKTVLRQVAQFEVS